MTDILWLMPDKPANISTGRNRIRRGLEARGFDVTPRVNRVRHGITQLTEWPDVIMASTAAGGFSAPPAKLQRIPFVADHVDPISQMYTTASRRMARFAEVLQTVEFHLADGILYVYDEERDRVTANGARVRQTTLGVDVERFADPDPDPQLFDELQRRGISPGFAVYIGGLEPIYNVDVMVEAAERWGGPFVVAGTGSEEHIVENAGENVHHLGVIDHERIPALLNLAGAGVCLVDDPHTVKVLEYAAGGLPIVHVRGRAEGVLPDAGVTWTDAEPGEVAAAYAAAVAAEPPTGTLRNYASGHDYDRVIGDYVEMVEAVL